MDPLLQAKLKEGFALHHQGKFAEAEAVYAQVLQSQPDNADALHFLGLLALQTRRTRQGVALIGRAVAIDADNAFAHNNLGSGLRALRRPEEALASYGKAIALKPDYAEAYYNRGLVLQDLKRPEEALAGFDKAIALNPGFAEAYTGRGNALAELKRLEEALSSHDRAIALKPGYAEAYGNRGNTLQNLKRPGEALASFDRAIALKPDFAEAYTSRGNALRDLKRPDEALASHDHALALKPDYAEACNNRGNALLDLKRFEEALASYDRAIALKPGYAEPYSNRANALMHLNRPEEALASCDQAVALKPDLAGAWAGRGNALILLSRHEQAAGAYAKALELEPHYPFLKGKFLRQKMLCYDWQGTGRLIAEIESDVAADKLSVEPFEWQGVARSEWSLQLCAELYNRKMFPANVTPDHRPRLPHKKIRIGYLSGEFGEHPAALLLAGVLEHHDRDSFEILAFDNGWDDRSQTRRRIEAAVPHIVAIARLGDSQACGVIGENQIDVLIDLNGYCDKERTSVFARRPAPIQVNYLGYPGTLGASYMDYIVADRRVIPEAHRVFYAEKVVYLPDCYQPNDRKKEIGTHVFTRAECGLPAQGLVFCCFNNSFKILPDTFDAWMRILKRVEGGVLWLREYGGTASANLRQEAVARGVAAERLIFAPRAPLPDHLARHRCADLFLDTLPFNAGTVASDALWAGLPVLTCLGETFAGRIAASLLNAIHLPELVTENLEDYERLAVELARNPDKLAGIKRKLASNRLTAPLFDTKLFTRHIEAAYAAMVERHRAGLAPDHIAVPGS